MTKREPDEIAFELHCLSAMTNVLSQAFAEGGRPDPELVESSFYGLSLQLERLSDEVSDLRVPKVTNRLREIREASGLDLKDLEMQTGISYELLRRIENDEVSYVNTRVIAKLAEALQVKPSEIFVA